MLNYFKTMETFFVFKVSLLYLPTQMKEKIIIKSSELFLNFGFKSITMDDIASKMGISKKTIYRYFKNKEELVSNSVTYLHEKISNSICEITKKGFNAIEENFVIKNMFTDIFEKSNTSPMYQLQKYYPKIYKHLIENEFIIFEECVSANIIKGIKEGLYRKNINEEVILKFYFLLIFGLHDENIFTYKNYSLNQLEIIALEYHTRAIATENGIKVLEKEMNKLLKINS